MPLDLAVILSVPPATDAARTLAINSCKLLTAQLALDSPLQVTHKGWKVRAALRYLILNRWDGHQFCHLFAGND